MHILPGLLCVSLLLAPGCSGLPTNGDSLRNAYTRQSILNIAKITLIHIKKLRAKLPGPPHMEFSSPAIEGLASICRDLHILDNELRNPETDLLSQIQADVSSMEGKVCLLGATMACPAQAAPMGHSRAALFPDTHSHLALAKAQRYVDAMLLSEDKLKVC